MVHYFEIYLHENKVQQQHCSVLDLYQSYFCKLVPFWLLQLKTRSFEVHFKTTPLLSGVHAAVTKRNYRMNFSNLILIGVFFLKNQSGSLELQNVLRKLGGVLRSTCFVVNFKIYHLIVSVNLPSPG